MKSSIFRLGAAVVILGVLAVTAVAQERGQGRGRGGQGGPGGGFGAQGGFGGRGMMGGAGGASAIIGLLRAPEVRKEVGLSDEAYTAVEKALQEMRPGGRGPGQGGPGQGGPGQGGPGQGGPGGFDREAMQRRTQEMNEKAEEILDEVLEPKGYDRLLGLYAQLNNYSAVTNEVIAKKISLSDDSKKKIEEAQAKMREEMMAQFRPGGQGGQGGQEGRGNPFGNPEEMRARIEEMRTKAEEAVSSNLTAEEKKAFEDLKGEKFEFPENLRRGIGGFGGAGQGGGGQGGGRGRGQGGRPDIQ
jgi:hypothetical protein